MIPLRQPGLPRASLHDDRLGQLLEALVAVKLHRGFGALALNALEVDAIPTPWAPSGDNDDHPVWSR